MTTVKLVLGTMTFGESVFEPDVEAFINAFLDTGYDELDTAYVYNEGQCEQLLGNALKTVNRPYKIATKVNPRISGKLDGEAANKQLNESLVRLGVDCVDVFYLHFPDRETPVEEVLSACAELHQQGKFKELGLSNFPAWKVVEVYDICKYNGWVVPTVYQGMYNPLSRKAEGELNDVLNHYGLRFYAYNPLAGGLLTGRYTDFESEPTDGRFTHRPNYQNRYWKKSFFEATKMIMEKCTERDMSIVEATYRWLAFHSMLNGDRGDAILIGASKLGHLMDNINAIGKGALDQEMEDAFSAAWECCRVDSPEYYRFYSGRKG